MADKKRGVKSSSFFIPFFVSLVALFLYVGCFSGSRVKKEGKLETQPIIRTEAEIEANLQKILVESENSPSLTMSSRFKTIGFASCLDQELPRPILSDILNENLDVLLLIGDNVYAAKPDRKPISGAYLKQLTDENFKKIYTTIPLLGIWDDHDFGVNDGGGMHPEYGEARSSFLSFFRNARTIVPKERKGVYYSFYVGQKPQALQIIFLDTRTHRTPLKIDPQDPEKKFVIPDFSAEAAILGQEQWAWLEEELKKPADLRILVSSIQLLPEEHPFEKWGNFPLEKERFFSLLERLRIKSLLVLSGDRHIAEVSEIKWSPKKSETSSGKKLKKGDRKRVFRILEITSSSLNKSKGGFNESNKYRVSPYIIPENFGKLELDWKKRQVRYSIRGTSGKLYHSGVYRF